jgi:hypothetical protein
MMISPIALLEVLISQMRQHRDIDAILGEALAVLGQPEFFEPIRDLLHAAHHRSVMA